MTAAMLEATEDAEDVAWTNCEDCGDSVPQSYAEGHEDLCPKCHHRARVDDCRSDLESAKEDLAGMLEELKELQERIAEGRQALKDARARLASLKSG